MRVLALDVGEKRIGMAFAETSVKIAVPVGMMPVDGQELQNIVDECKKRGVNILVFGLPRNNNGELTEQSRKVQGFASKLKRFATQNGLSLSVAWQDETLSSVQAESQLGHKEDNLRDEQKFRASGRLDAEAAAIILQDFLERMASFVAGKKATSQAEPVEPKIQEDNSVTTKPEQDQNLAQTKKAKPRHKGKIFLLGLLLLLALGGGAFGYYQIMLGAPKKACVNKVADAQCPLKEFEVKNGMTTEQIAALLKQEGIIRDQNIFRLYLMFERRGAVLRTGKYQMTQGMTVAEVVKKLGEGGKAATFRLTLLPGEKLKDTKAKFIQVGFRKEDVERAFSQDYQHLLLADKPAGASLEGYIMGDTYEFYANVKIETVLSTLFDAYYKFLVEHKVIEGFRAQGLNIHEGISLASVVQREAGSLKSEMPQVAQVFLTRLKQDIPLGSDAIIGYRASMIDPNRDPKDLSFLDKIGCPWNSRRCKGLPPTPIAHPGKEALQAVAKPAEGNYLYFLTDDEGKMRYAYNESEHNENVRKYCKKMCRIL